MKLHFNLLLSRAFDHGRRAGHLFLGIIILTILPSTLRAASEQRFDSPEKAIEALSTAAKATDTNALHQIFGPTAHDLISPDLVQASEEREIFLKRVSENIELSSGSDSPKNIEIGADHWPFPIPLVKKDGQWFFDIQAGKEEILNRRIGQNELSTIRVCHAYVDAQREYATADRDADQIFEYAQQLRSSPGTHDGLYWSTKDGAETSPFGPLIAQARFEGYRQDKKIMTDDCAPYHGYYFKILTRQGKHAAGGKYNYIINGHMIAGFALVAWPAEWSNSGVMTFIVNQQGKVYQKNLGPKTESIAHTIATFDPDPSWTEAKD